MSSGTGSPTQRHPPTRTHLQRSPAARTANEHSLARALLHLFLGANGEMRTCERMRQHDGANDSIMLTARVCVRKYILYLICGGAAFAPCSLPPERRNRDARTRRTRICLKCVRAWQNGFGGNTALRGLGKMTRTHTHTAMAAQLFTPLCEVR